MLPEDTNRLRQHIKNMLQRVRADFRIVNHGTIWTFQPLTTQAVDHAERHFPADCPMFGEAYVVEHRYADAIVEDIAANGFRMER